MGVGNRAVAINATSKSVARGIASVMAIYLAAAIVGFALRRSDYSHLQNSISELGEFGARDSALVSWGVFFPVGLGAAALAVHFWRNGARAAGILAACIATGYIVAAFFRCDPGSPLSGSGRQAIHNLGGAVEYFGGAAALLLMARGSPRLRWVFAIAGVVVLLVSIGVSVPDLAHLRGLIQRCGETCQFGALILAAAPRA